MRFKFLGTGSAFTVGDENCHSNMLLTSPAGRRLLIDAGADVRTSLYNEGLCHRDITDIYVSHLHADHVGGLESLGFQCKFDPTCCRPRLHLSEDLVGPLWEHTLRGGMGHIVGERASLGTYFEPLPVPRGGRFTWEGLELQLVSTVHVRSLEHDVLSHGLAFSVGPISVYLTTDTVFDPGSLEPHYRAADIIFHDCETAPVASGVHPHYEELLQLPDNVRAKTWLYHYQPEKLQDACADGFLGFVLPGQEFTFLASVQTGQSPGGAPGHG
jgi:phosphoribosyl 1,2-cyclic phosphodiesterase